MPPFVDFGVAHLAALAVIAGLAVGFVRLARGRAGITVATRLTLAAALTLLAGFELLRGACEGWLSWEEVVPLQLCDAAVVLSVAMLIRPWRAAIEVLYFWTCAGTALALLTPDLAVGFPRWEFFVFFGLHGLVIVAALLLVFGLGHRPRPGAPRRVFGVTCAYAAAVGLVDRIFGTNYLYLCAKPPNPTLLDWLGPWPAYLGASALIALIAFHLLALPFRGAWRREV